MNTQKKRFRHIILVTNDLTHDRRMIRTCQSLTKLGQKVLFIGRLCKNSDPLKETLYDQKRLICWFVKGPLFYMELWIRMIIDLHKLDFDVLTCVDLDTIVVGTYFKKIRAIKCYYDSHELFSEVPELAGRSFKKWIWIKIGELCIPRMDKCYTVGEELAKLLSHMYHMDFTVVKNVPHALDLSNTSFEKNHLFTIIYLGVLNEGRGLLETIRSMVNVENVVLWIVGGGMEEKRLQGEVEKLNLKDRVQFYGMVSPEKISEFLCQAHLGLNLLNRESISYYYSLSNKYFDYLNHGIPVLTMDFPAYASLNNQYECSWLVADLHTETLTKTMKNIVGNKEIYHAKKRNAEEARKHFNWEKEESKLIALYND